MAFVVPAAATRGKSEVRMRDVARHNRLMCTAIMVAVCAGVCVAFWLGAPSWNRTILGRYSVKWFTGSVIANAAVILFTLIWVRWLWSERHQRSRDAHRLATPKKVLFAGIVLLPILTGVEVGLRHFYFPPPPRLWKPEAGTLLKYHALLQHADRVSQDGIPARAYRGRTYQRKKTTESRIVCLGGSTTWGHVLEREESWPAMLEENLRQLGYDVEIINAGRPWYTTAHSVINYALQMRYYDADIVIVMHGVNDLARSFPAEGEPPPEWDYGSYQGPMRNVLAGYRIHHRRQQWAICHPIRLLCSTAIYRLIFGPELDRNRPPDVDVGTEAFTTLDSFRAHLDYLARLCLADRRSVVVATQAHVYEREDLSSLCDFKKTIRQTYMQTADGAAISAESLRGGMRALRAVTLEVAVDLDIPLANIDRAVGERLDYFMDDFHLTASGNAVVAEAFVEVLRPILDKNEG